jgi:hypothetical protein
MCGVDMSVNKAKRTEQLCVVKPLKDNLAFELVNGNEIWHPCWKDKIDDEVNAQFIRAVINHIQQNKEVSLVCWMMVYWYSHLMQHVRGRNNGKGEIKDADFTVSAIIECVKTYWRNVHKQYSLRCDPVKHKKTKDVGKHRIRRGTVR